MFVIRYVYTRANNPISTDVHNNNNKVTGKKLLMLPFSLVAVDVL